MPKRLVLIAPALDVHEAHRRVVQLAVHDFAELQPERADRLRMLLTRTRRLFDTDMQEALAIAADDPFLFRHYWQDENAFDGFAATLARPEAQFNPATFFAVLAGLASLGCDYLRPSRPFDVETVVLLGGRDPVVDLSAAGSGARILFSRVDERVVEGSGHWVHLEHPDVFLDLLTKS